mmetsp:Transcript_23425/g.26270  ORF Transcript_23425/g.26270 Transcript_23425/m.26270 type:complete len:81 (-) Transcript_23425:597-839(-)
MQKKTATASHFSNPKRIKARLGKDTHYNTVFENRLVIERLSFIIDDLFLCIGHGHMYNFNFPSGLPAVRETLGSLRDSLG